MDLKHAMKVLEHSHNVLHGNVSDPNCLYCNPEELKIAEAVVNSKHQCAPRGSCR